MNKIKIFIIVLAIGIAASFGCTDGHSENNPEESVVLVNVENLASDIKPLFISDDFALVYESDIPPNTKGTVRILSDQPGDYYIMRIISPEDLKPIEGTIPYFLIGENAVFRTDADGTDILPSYGWGLTALRKRTNFKKSYPEFALSTISTYDPDIANMISNITASSCLSTLSDITSFPTRYSYTDTCRQAEQYVYNQFTSLPLSVSFYNFTYNGTPMKNVIGEMTGITQPNNVVIICGHLDSTSDDPWNEAPGAEDNGSGSTAVIEAAKVLSQYQTDLTVRFITFSGEEQGLRGSYDYVDHMVDIGEDITAVINLDMVAYQGPYYYDMHVFSDNQSYWLADLALEAISHYTSITGIDDYHDYPQYGSDHYPFAVEGYPAIFFIDAWRSGLDWYPYYHTTNDIVDHLNMDLLADVSRAGAALAAVLAVVHFDSDGDTINNNMDNCPYYYNPDQVDSDDDTIGDVCDNCPDNYNPDQEDNDQDHLGDTCDPDDDNDTVLDESDNCSLVANPSQDDEDQDEVGDVCDNCSDTPNQNQEDSYPPGGNECGDACECEGDFDSNGVVDGLDASTFKTDFGRFDCDAGNPCNGDFDCSGVVDGLGAVMFKQEFGRFDCPSCETDPWCGYE